MIGVARHVPFVAWTWSRGAGGEGRNRELTSRQRRASVQSEEGYLGRVWVQGAAPGTCRPVGGGAGDLSSCGPHSPV
jgi:hypothetical protein